MLRTGLEDHKYNSQVALAKLEALCTDALKAATPVSILSIPWENLEGSWISRNLSSFIQNLLVNPSNSCLQDCSRLNRILFRICPNFCSNVFLNWEWRILPGFTLESSRDLDRNSRQDSVNNLSKFLSKSLLIPDARILVGFIAILVEDLRKITRSIGSRNGQIVSKCWSGSSCNFYAFLFRESFL